MVNEEYANLQSKVFFIWGSFCGVCILFVWFMIFETKGLSLEEVDELYGRGLKAWQSTKFVPEISFMDADEMQKKGGRTMSISEVAEETTRKKSVTHVEAEKPIA